jgi:hypothetical protein
MSLPRAGEMTGEATPVRVRQGPSERAPAPFTPLAAAASCRPRWRRHLRDGCGDTGHLAPLTVGWVDPSSTSSVTPP